MSSGEREEEVRSQENRWSSMGLIDWHPQKARGWRYKNQRDPVLNKIDGVRLQTLTLPQMARARTVS